MTADVVVIGIGGNVGTEAAIIERFRAAREAIAQLGAVRSAPLYRTAPIGPVQAPFLNTALALRGCDLEPAALMATLLELEHLLGRRREVEPRGLPAGLSAAEGRCGGIAARWGPRTIDLDVLVWGDRTVRSALLEVPHPRLAERRFALAPVVDLLGEAATIPGVGVAGAALAAVSAQAIEWVDQRW